MSVHQVARAWEIEGCSPEAKLVALYLADQNANWESWCGVEPVCHSCIVTAEELVVALNELVAIDYVAFWRMKDSALLIRYVEEQRGPNQSGPYSISDSVRQSIFDRDGWKCLRCGTVDNLTIDHIIPQSKGGTHDSDNLQTLCDRCNKSKKTKTIDFRRGV